MEVLIVKRTNKTDLKFLGKRLYHKTSSFVNQKAEYIAVYETEAKKIIVEKTQLAQVGIICDVYHRDVAMFDDINDITSFFGLADNAKDLYYHLKLDIFELVP